MYFTARKLLATEFSFHVHISASMVIYHIAISVFVGCNHLSVVNIGFPGSNSALISLALEMSLNIAVFLKSQHHKSTIRLY